MSLLDRDDAALAGVSKLRFFPLAVTGGSGGWLVEEGGRRVLDLSAGWTAAGLGYGHPRIVEAVTSALRDQSGASGLSAVNQHMVGLAEDLRRITPIVAAQPDRRVYLGNSGTDANEAVLRSCRLATGRRRILAFHRGYHGGLGVAMGVSGLYVDAGIPGDADSTLLHFPRRPDEVASVLADLAHERALLFRHCLMSFLQPSALPQALGRRLWQWRRWAAPVAWRGPGVRGRTESG